MPAPQLLSPLILRTGSILVEIKEKKKGGRTAGVAQAGAGRCLSQSHGKERPQWQWEPRASQHLGERKSPITTCWVRDPDNPVPKSSAGFRYKRRTPRGLRELATPRSLSLGSGTEQGGKALCTTQARTTLEAFKAHGPRSPQHRQQGARKGSGTAVIHYTGGRGSRDQREQKQRSAMLHIGLNSRGS